MTCAGSSLILTVNRESEPRAVSCGTDRTMTVPTGRTLALSFDAQNDTTFSATVRFSPAAFRSDTTLTSQCKAATTALSDIMTADNGLGQGAISSSQAQTLMAHAAQALEGTSTAGVAGQELAALRTWLIGNPTADPRTAPMPATMNELCADNESPLLISSSYGG